MSTKEPLNLKTFSEETAEALEQEAQEYFNTNDSFAPKDRPLALAYYNDAPGGIGGGTPCVAWFGGEKGLLEVLANYLLITNPGPCNTDYKGISEAIAAAVSDFWQGKISKDKAIETINDQAHGCFHVQWWGNRKSLLFGNEEFPKELRSWWRDHKKDGDTSPLQPDEVDGFLQYLECDYMT
jgi:hypothetical protein